MDNSFWNVDISGRLIKKHRKKLSGSIYVMMAIESSSPVGSFSRITEKTICDMLGMSERSVSRHLARLEHNGFIKRINIGHFGKAYAIMARISTGGITATDADIERFILSL